MLLGVPFPAWFICEMFPKRKKSCTMQFRTAIYSHKTVGKKIRTTVAIRTIKVSFAPYKAVVQTEIQHIFQPYTEIRVNAKTNASDLSLINPSQRSQRHSHLHVASIIIEQSRDCTFGSFSSNFGLIMQLLRIQMVVAYAVAPPAVIIG